MMLCNDIVISYHAMSPHIWSHHIAFHHIKGAHVTLDKIAVVGSRGLLVKKCHHFQMFIYLC